MRSKRGASDTPWPSIYQDTDVYDTWPAKRSLKSGYELYVIHITFNLCDRYNTVVEQEYCCKLHET